MTVRTELDFPQIIQSVYDPDNEALNVNAEITANISGPQEVIISSIDDNITIGDASGNLATVTNGALNVNAQVTVPGTITTTEAGLSNFQTSQYIIGTSIVQITPSPLANRSSLSLRVTATSSDAIFIGNNSSLTLSNGYPLHDGDTLQMDLTPANTIYAIATSAGQVLYVLEIA